MSICSCSPKCECFGPKSSCWPPRRVLLTTLVHFRWQTRIHTSTPAPVDLSLSCRLLCFSCRIQSYGGWHTAVYQTEMRICVCADVSVCVYPFLLCMHDSSSGGVFAKNVTAIIFSKDILISNTGWIAASAQHAQDVFKDWPILGLHGKTPGVLIHFEAPAEGWIINPSTFTDFASKKTRHLLFYFCAFTKQQSRQTELSNGKYLGMFALSLSVKIRSNLGNLIYCIVTHGPKCVALK